MKKVLVITTTNDISLPLFFLDANENLSIQVILYEDDAKTFSQVNAQLESFDIIYARDPFNSNMVKEWEDKIKPILETISNKAIKSIDNIRDIKDFYIEDKWEQYQLLNEYMPNTQILLSKTKFSPETQIIKKRISSRSKGILFEIDGIQDPSQYIVQEKLQIEQEFRVFTCFDEIISPAVYKSSKTKDIKVKIDRTKTKEIDHKLNLFIRQVLDRLNLDFLGIDVALTKDNEYQLIEINRSPQFKAFYEATNINLAPQVLL